MARNLIKNPNGDEKMKFWELTRNGGDKWGVEDMREHKFRSDVTKYFCTSFALCLKKQVIDLVKEGYSPADLDSQPLITVEDWYCSRTDCGCLYQLSVYLLDEKKKILAEYSPEKVTIDPDTDNCSWRQAIYTFYDYGPGVRFISFEHGGKDTKYWKGWYGVRVTGSSITLDF